MSDNLTGSDEGVEVVEEVSTPELFYGASEQEPTETADTVAEEELAEVEEEAAEQVSESEDTEEDDEDALVFDKPNDFAKYDFDEETGLYEFKSDGKKVKVNPETLISSFQMKDMLDRKLEEVANERKGVFGEAKSKELKALQDQAKQYQDAVGKLQQLVSDSEKTEEYWEELRDTDPSEFLRQKGIEEKRKQAISEAQYNQSVALEQRKKQVISEQSQKLIELVGDDWKDTEVMNKDFAEMQKTMLDYGVSEEEQSALLDARGWLMARDAMKYKELQKKASSTKEVKKSPKVIKTRQAPTKNAQKSATELFYGSK